MHAPSATTSLSALPILMLHIAAAQGLAQSPPSWLGADDFMLHSPIPVRVNDMITDDYSNLAANSSGRPMWGRQAPMFAHAGDYFYSVVSSALRAEYDGQSPQEHRYYRDVTLFKRKYDSLTWQQVWTENWSSPDDGGEGTRRAFEQPILLIDNYDEETTPGDRRLHIIFTGIDDITLVANQTYKVKHYSFPLHTTTGDLTSTTPTSHSATTLGDKITRAGAAATRELRYLYYAGPEFGTASVRSPDVAIGRFNPANSTWTKANTYSPSYLTSTTEEDTLQYLAVDGFRHRMWILGSVHNWDADDELRCNGNSENEDDFVRNGYTHGARLICFSNYGNTFQYDVRLDDNPGSTIDCVAAEPFNTTFGIDLLVNQVSGSEYRVFCLAMSQVIGDCDRVNRLYVYDHVDGGSTTPESATLTLLKVIDVPGLTGNVASLYYDENESYLYVAGRITPDQVVAIWRIEDDDLNWYDTECPSWDWAGVPVQHPPAIAGWPGQSIEDVQCLAFKAGGDLPQDGLHVLTAIRMFDWISAYNITAHKNEAESEETMSPGRLMRDARGVWELNIQIDEE